MLYLDGLGAAMFRIQAAEKVWDLGFGLPVAPVFLGIVTAIGGGIIWNVLLERPTLLMRPEIYPVPICLGCTAFAALLNYLQNYHDLGAGFCILTTFAMRDAAIHWNLKMPVLVRTGGESR